MAGSTIVLTPAAHAYSPNPTAKPGPTSISTAQSRTLNDPIDGTYFHKDPGGYGATIELGQNGHYIGKVEFHPYGEKLFVYNTRNDGNSFYVKVQSPGSDIEVYDRPSSSRRVDLAEFDLHFAEGKPVYITVYDNFGQSDQLAYVTANA